MNIKNMNIKSLLIFIITILVAASSISFGMEISTTTTPDKITIQCIDKLVELERKNGAKKPGDILKTSQTITNLLQCMEEKDLGQKTPLTMLATNFNYAYEYMELIANNQKQAITEINKKLQNSDIGTLCKQLHAFNYLDIRVPVKDKEDVGLTDICSQAIVNKFDYRNDEHYQWIDTCLENDHKKMITDNISRKLSITAVPLSVCLSQNNEDKAIVIPKQALERSLDLLINRRLIENITTAVQKGNWHFSGHKDGRVFRVCFSPKLLAQIIGNHLFLFMAPIIKLITKEYVMVIDDKTANGQLFSGHKASITSMDLHPTKLLLVTADSTQVKLWDLNTSHCIRTFEKDTDNRVADGDFDAATIRFSDDGTKIISGSENNPTSSWDVYNPYDVVKELIAKKDTLKNNELFKKILQNIPEDKNTWFRWILDNKKLLIAGGLALCTLLYHKRSAILPFLQSLSPL